MSASNFNRNRDQHILISAKISKKLEKPGQDLLKLLSSLDQKISDKILIKLINIFVHGISVIIPDLQDIVIKINPKEENSADLKDMVKKLSQYCNDMVQIYDSDSNNTTKQKFIIFIQNILREVENLLNIIKKDAHHDFKHELIKILKDIMYTIKICHTRIQIENYNLQELKNIVEEQQKKYLENITIIKNCSAEVLKPLVIHVKYNIGRVLQMAYHLNNVASNFRALEIQNKIINAAYNLNMRNTSFLIAKLTDTEQGIMELKNYCIYGWGTVKGLFELVEVSVDDEKDSENLSEIAKYIISNGVVIGAHLGKSIKNDILFV